MSIDIAVFALLTAENTLHYGPPFPLQNCPLTLRGISTPI